MNKTIRVWRFKDAPARYRALSQAGGDEDWVAVVPKELSEACLDWMEEGTSFGVCAVKEYAPEWLNGYIVRIGQHA